MTLPNPTSTASEPTAQNKPVHTIQPGPAANPNGSPLPKPPRLPHSRKRSKLYWLLLPVGAVFLLVVIVVSWSYVVGAQTRTDLVTRKVEYRDLQVKVVERGTLEAIENHDVKCEVKAGSRGAPKIMGVVDNGAVVEKGDPLVEIDDSYLVEQATDKKIALDNAESAMIAAEQNYPIAKENLKQWDEGDYPQTRDQYKGLIQVADSTYQQQKDRTAWVSRMVKKGYMTVSQEESEKANEEGCRLDLAQKKTQLEVLEKYTNPTKHETLKNLITVAEADLRFKKQIYVRAKAQYDDFLKQIQQCKIFAPNSGIVVYATSEQTRMGARLNPVDHCPGRAGSSSARR